jgi:hypothetical protein
MLAFCEGRMSVTADEKNIKTQEGWKGSWSVTVKEEHRVSMLKNRELGNIFGFKGLEVTGDWRKLHN